MSSLTPNTQTLLCLRAASLASSDLLKIIFGIKITLMVFATILPVWFWMKRGLKWLLHPNTKCFWATHLASTILFCASQIPVTIYELIRIILQYDNPCSYLVPIYIAFPVKIVPQIARMVMQMAMLLLTVERGFATCFPEFYEHVTSSKMGILLSCVSIIISVIMGLLIVLIGTDWSQMLTSVTLWTDSNSSIYSIWSDVLMYILVCTVIILTFVFILNCALHKQILKTRDTNLSNRYQIVENRRITFWLLPVFTLNLLLNLINSFGFRIFSYLWKKLDRVGTSLFVESLSQTHIYGILMPLILELLLRRSRSKVVEQTTQDDHFKQLQQMFN